ncbi:hypothetical protein GQ43DRAFT_240012 [Delitschia confertaspora ATCC 74209]|uniref:Secreted protein n=1 Tax=Delitschia confertaspora ATCC 74209 TaxID=1513339 RepID=A0A9P4MS74_9PLEO|nr:hypothetical protein GQ43DRAFT_240012 [Delitschia confertaspora ATCC 74209]
MIAFHFKHNNILLLCLTSHVIMTHKAVHQWIGRQHRHWNFGSSKSLSSFSVVEYTAHFFMHLSATPLLTRVKKRDYDCYDIHPSFP